MDAFTLRDRAFAVLALTRAQIPGHARLEVKPPGQGMRATAIALTAGQLRELAAAALVLADALESGDGKPAA